MNTKSAAKHRSFGRGMPSTDIPDAVNVNGLSKAIRDGYKAACARRGITCGYNGRKYVGGRVVAREDAT